MSVQGGVFSHDNILFSSLSNCSCLLKFSLFSFGDVVVVSLKAEIICTSIFLMYFPVVYRTAFTLIEKIKSTTWSLNSDCNVLKESVVHWT